MQLNGRGKTPEEREKILRKLSGIKEPPKKKEKEKKPKGAEKSQAALAVGSAARGEARRSQGRIEKAGKAAAAKSAGGKSTAKAAKKHAAPARAIFWKKRAPVASESVADRRKIDRPEEIQIAGRIYRRVDLQSSFMGQPQFVHLHVHTDFSLLDGACETGELLDEASRQKMPAVAITDHGNLFRRRQFLPRSRQARRQAHHRLRSVRRQRQPPRARRKISARRIERRSR